MVAPSSDTKSGGGIEGLIRGHAGAATMAGTLEIAFFHPFDTIAKRLMSDKSNVAAGTVAERFANANKAIFKEKANAALTTKVAYLYPGSLYAVTYKVLQRVYKFAGQPIVKDKMDVTVGPFMKNTFGNKSKMMTESLAGSLIGIGEVVLLPLDRLKVLSQTNEATLKSKSLAQIVRSEGIRGMYAGTAVTMTRNAPGSFCLFGGAAFTKDVIFGLEDYRSATFAQNIAASTVGSCLSITVTNPMDVIKTRIQNKDIGSKNVSALAVLGELVKAEGPSGLLKGVTPKVLASAPKLVFAYTMTEYFKKLIAPKK